MKVQLFYFEIHVVFIISPRPLEKLYVNGSAFIFYDFHTWFGNVLKP